VVWAIGTAIVLLLLSAFAEMAISGVEEELKPERICSSCALNCGVPVEGDEIVWLAPNRTCPVCFRVWGDYQPYYFQDLRRPIRRKFGIVTF
jgi:hypothetical protein